MRFIGVRRGRLRAGLAGEGEGGGVGRVGGELTLRRLEGRSGRCWGGRRAWSLLLLAGAVWCARWGGLTVCHVLRVVHR